MEEQATALLATLKRSSASVDTKVQAFNTLKAAVKHQRVPDAAQSTIFECIRLAITSQQSPTLVNIGFSTLGHLIKRLTIQDQGQVVAAQGTKLLPVLLERLGDAREANRSAAVSTLVDLWPLSKEKVETLVRDGAMVSNNARAKEASMKWIAKMHKVQGFHFRSFVPHLVAGLEDADGIVRETAKAAVVELFTSAPERAKSDLKRQMAANNVRKATVQYVEAQLAGRPALEPAADLKASTVSHSASAIENTNVPDFNLGDSTIAEHPPTAEPVQMDPLYFHSERDMSDAFRDMLPHFEGKETEHNWIPRDKSVTKIRRMAQGNAPVDYHVAFLMGVKSMQDGINKVANSLRTTMSTNGCQCVQELARTLGPSFDAMADIFLQGFLKMSGATKHIAQENGKMTFDTIIANVSYHKRLMELVWSAFQEKNVAIRQSATTWLRTLLKRSVPKSHFEGSIELVEKCLKKGLADANPNVKNSTRATFWVYTRSWPAKAEPFREDLEPRTQKFLDQDPNNNGASLASSQSSTGTKAGERPLTAQSGRASIRETILAQRKAAAAAAKIERPSSAQSVLSPAAHSKPRLAQSTRQASNLSTVSSKAGTASNATGSTAGGGLMSAPLRRPRKAELARPATADPYASRNKTARSGQLATPSDSPVGSPGRESTSTVKKSPSKSARAGASHIPVSPPRAKSRVEQLAQSTRKRPVSADPSTIAGSTPSKADDLTYVIPFTAPPTDDEDPAVALARKRAGMDKTMSGDSGVSGLAGSPVEDGDEGFTMVLPPGIQLDKPTPAPVSHIPTPKGSPRKLTTASPRTTPSTAVSDAGSPSKSPAARLSRILPERQLFQDDASVDTATDGEVKVYEDPVLTHEDEPSTPRATSPEKTVLEELPLSDHNVGPSDHVDGSASVRSTGSNEQNRPVMQSPTRSPLKSNGDNVEVTHDRAETLRSRKLLSSGIERVRARTLDAHGFRRLQDLIKQNNADIWSVDSSAATDGAPLSPQKQRQHSKFDDLLLALSSFLSTPLDSTKFPTSKAHNLKTQALATLRGMLTLWPRQSERYAPHVLCAVIEARGECDTSSHLDSELERTTDEIIAAIAKAGNVGNAMDVLLALIEDDADPDMTADETKTHARVIPAALAALAALLALSKSTRQAPSANTMLPEQQAGRLGTVAVKFLSDHEPDVRKADMEFCLELHDRLGGGKVGDSVFWKSLQAAGLRPEQVNLITYYLARRAKA